MISHRIRPIGRRDLLGLAATAFVAAIPLRLARAQAAGDVSATAPVEQLDNALLAAMKGQVFESPRGPVLIDAQTRDIVQDVYIRKVEKKNGQLYNVEFATYNDVKDPIKAAAKK